MYETNFNFNQVSNCEVYEAEKNLPTQSVPDSLKPVGQLLGQVKLPGVSAQKEERTHPATVVLGITVPSVSTH